MKTKVKRVYFLGIGGIGMSALARYFRSVGLPVWGYDHVCTPLTEKLVAEGMGVIYDDRVELLPASITNGDVESTLVIYTPAVPHDLALMRYFRSQGFHLYKRAEVLGWLCDERVCGVAVAGAHGKTTTTSLLTHLLNHVAGCLGFLGGISVNYGTNFVDGRLRHAKKDEPLYCVVEADEYDRSFLHLTPYIGMVTSLAPDHLDVFGSFEHVVEAFREYARRLRSGKLVVQGNVASYFAEMPVELIRYGVVSSGEESAWQYYATDLHYLGGYSVFNLHTPDGVMKAWELGVVGAFNVENAVGALAVLSTLGFSLEAFREPMRTFQGVERRFQVRYHGNDVVLIDDYAHHPEELRATIATARTIYTERHVVGLFQPHLYSRTRDFAKEFVEVLQELDEVFLLPIYAAREQPIEGVTSDHLGEALSAFCACRVVEPSGLEPLLESLPTRSVLLCMGAGDIGLMIPRMVNYLQQRAEHVDQRELEL